MASSETFDTSRRFADLGLPAPVLQALQEKGFEHPTKIQAALLPVALSGRDCLGQAKTGTGKTAAFALPMLARIPKEAAFGGLVLVPTRELAIQVAKEFHEFARHSGHAVVAVYGGHSVNAQATKLNTAHFTQVAEDGKNNDYKKAWTNLSVERGNLVPFAFATMGGIGDAARNYLKQVANTMSKDDMTLAYSVAIRQLVETISVCIQRNNARTLAVYCKSVTEPRSRPREPLTSSSEKQGVEQSTQETELF